MALLTLGAFGLVQCGPAEPELQGPQSIQKDLLVKSSRNSNRQINTVTLKNKSGKTVNLYFDYDPNQNQTLQLESPSIKIERELSCEFQLTIQWGEKLRGQKDFKYEAISTWDRLYVKRGSEYRMWWTFENLENCGELKVEFAVIDL